MYFRAFVKEEVGSRLLDTKNKKRKSRPFVWAANKKASGKAVSRSAGCSSVRGLSGQMPWGTWFQVSGFRFQVSSFKIQV